MTSIGFWEYALGAPLVGAGFSFGFVVVRWCANFIAGRIDIREARLDAGMAELIDGLKEECQRLSAECKDLRATMVSHGRELAECRKKHAESEAEVMKLKAMLAGFGDARQHAQLIVAAEKLKPGRK